MKPEIKFGLLIGAAVCLWILLEFVLGLHSERRALGEYTGYLSNLVPLTGLFLLLRRKQAAIYDGRLSLASGIGTGLLTSLVASMLVYIFLNTYSQFINPGWIDQTLEWQVAQLRAAATPEVKIQEHITLFRQAYAPVGLVISVIVNRTVLGGVFGLILVLLINRLPRRAA